MSGRIRTVKPEWLEDERLAMASSDARVLSIALVLLADDHGRGRANLTMLAGRVFPGLDDPRETLAKALDDLATGRFVRLYEVDGQSYFEIRNWTKHQKVDHPGKPHVPPPGPESFDNPDVRESSRESRESSRESRESLAPDLRPTTSTNDRDQRASEGSRKVEHSDVTALYSRLRAEAHQAKHGKPGGKFVRTTKTWQPTEDLCTWANAQDEPHAALEDSLRGYLADTWAIGADWPLSTWALAPERYMGRSDAVAGATASLVDEIEAAMAECEERRQGAVPGPERDALRRRWFELQADLRNARGAA